MIGALLAVVIDASGALADDERATAEADLVKQANAPISSILQIRLQDSDAPQFWAAHGQGNTFSIALTMPLPEYRLLPFPQLSLLTLPVAITLPGGVTGFGDVRLTDIAVLNTGHRFLWGLGATLIFPTATVPAAGQGKWQAGPAAAAFVTKDWLIGVLAQNPISFAGDRKRADTNALFLQPFAIYQLGRGWFIRSQPQLIFKLEGWQASPSARLGRGTGLQDRASRRESLRGTVLEHLPRRARPSIRDHVRRVPPVSRFLASAMSVGGSRGGRRTWRRRHGAGLALFSQIPPTP